MESVRILKIIGENSAHVRWHMFAVCRAVSLGLLSLNAPCPLDDKQEKKLVDQSAYHIDIIVCAYSECSDAPSPSVSILTKRTI
jgi:hypothetical protein